MRGSAAQRVLQYLGILGLPGGGRNVLGTALHQRFGRQADGIVGVDGGVGRPQAQDVGGRRLEDWHGGDRRQRRGRSQEAGRAWSVGRRSGRVWRRGGGVMGRSRTVRGSGWAVRGRGRRVGGGRW